MPYVTCSGCAALTYVPRSYLVRPERCPACGTELDAAALLPIATRRSGAGAELSVPPEITENDGARPQTF
jgi:hypothetical protein